MKKIMFNDAYGLTQATIEGYKKNTRRNEFTKAEQTRLTNLVNAGYRLVIQDDCVKVYAEDATLLFSKPTRYKVGEIVAVAQRYAEIEDLAMLQRNPFHESYFEEEDIADEPGWRNKMFVKAKLMPHRIRITGIRAERLQDISDEDCIKEGILEDNFPFGEGYYFGCFFPERDNFATPREAFAALINKVSGRGTWARNPWVVAYEYELIK